MSSKKGLKDTSSQQTPPRSCKHCGTTYDLAPARFECKSCRASVEKERYYTNRDKLLQQKREKYENNTEEMQLYNKIQYNKHIVKRRKYSEALRRCPKNKERIKEYNSRYKPIRRAFELNARVSFDRPEEAPINLWKVCRFLKSMTGRTYEVDHKIPLKNKEVCGLHCLSNLQILTLHENRRKGNKFNERMVS